MFKAKEFSVPLAAVASLACATLPRSRAQTCQPTHDPRPITQPFDFSRIAGEYLVTFVATTGERAGRSVSGRLTLFPRDSVRWRPRTINGTPNPYLTEPLGGSASIELGQLGAVYPGRIDGTDPDAPGVILRVMQMRDNSWETTLMFGNTNNRQNAAVLDGPYFGASITEVTRSGFRGTWDSSLGITTYRAAGFFCALRSGPG